MADLNKVDPLSTNSKITEPGGTPTAFLLRQWALIRSFVNAVGTSVAGLVARVAALETAQVTTTAPISGGGTLLNFTPISHDDSAVTSGTYGDATNIPQITVDAKGHVTEVVDIPFSAGAWSLISLWDFAVSGALASFVVTGLAGKTDILLVIDEVSLSGAAGLRVNVEVSVNNGSTYFSTVGDYLTIPTNGGTGASETGFALRLAASPVAQPRSGYCLLIGADITGTPKLGQTSLNSGVGAPSTLFRGSSSPINAVRALTVGGAANFNSGKIYLLAR